MDRTALLAALRREFEGGGSNQELREDVSKRIDALLAPFYGEEKIDIMKQVKADMEADYARVQQRFAVLRLALTSQMVVSAKDDYEIRFQAIEHADTVLHHARPAELRRALAEAGKCAVRQCGRPDIGLDPFAVAVRASTLLPGSEVYERLGLDDASIKAAHGTLHRAARWALFGFNVFSPFAALAAKLVLTDVSDDAAPPLPYDTFVIALPEGVIPFFVGDPNASRKEWADSIWVHRAVVAPGEEPVVVVSVAWRRFVINCQAPAPTSALGPSPHRGEHLAPEDEVAVEGAWRLARNFLLWLDASGGLKKHRPTAAPRKLQEKRARGGATWPTEWEFGREVAITPELREAAREAVAGRTRRHAAEGWQVRSRFIVRGHWRNQAHGEGRSQRRRQWIPPFWKGPEGAKAWSHIYEGK